MPDPQRCVRQGCPGEVTDNAFKSGFKHCSNICAAVDRALSMAERKNVSAETWAALVTAADTVSEWRGQVVADYHRNGSARGKRRKAAQRPPAWPCTS